MMEKTEQMQDVLQLEALTLSRAYLYTLFHKLFGGAPDEDVLDALLGPVTADVVDEFSAASEELQAFGGFLESLRDVVRAGLLDNAKDEYTRVFVGPLALPASPYESPYTGAHDMATFQQNTLDVRAIYRSCNLRVRREQAVPDDHVALMCAFAAEVSKRALKALRSGDYDGFSALLREQHSFATAHLANWLGVYATSVRNSKAGSQAVMYPQLLEALDAFVRSDVEFLAESAYWAESQEAPSERPSDCAPELADAQSALDALEQLRPFGIQDNELVPAN